MLRYDTNYFRASENSVVTMNNIVKKYTQVKSIIIMCCLLYLAVMVDW